MALQLKLVVSFLTDSDWFSDCSLPMGSSPLMPHVEVGSRRWPQNGKRCGLALGALWVPVDPREREIPGCGIPRGLWMGFLKTAVRQECSLLPASCSNLLSSPNHGCPMSYTGCCWKNQQVSPVTSCTARVAGTHSLLFPLREILRLLDTSAWVQCFLGKGGGGDTLGKFFLLPPPLWPNSYFLQNGVLKSSLGKAGLLQILYHAWVSTQVSTLQVSSQPGWEGSEQVGWLPWFCGPYQRLFNYYWPHRCE